jgi:type IV pilus assembly protein PilB
MQDNHGGRNIGTVLLELGRVSEQDIERALEHQRIQGGYFGQALVDLGIVEQEELDFGLAAQANLPYVVPDVDTIDPEVAGLVPPTWAQRHNAMPIARDDGWLTLLLDSPLKAGLAEPLSRRTGLSVKLALCSPRTVRDAIRQVYKLEPVREKAERVLSTEAFWTLASSPSAKRWGMSVRRDLVVGWIDDGQSMQRHPLMHNWLAFLDRLLSPPPSQLLPDHGMREWRASVRPDHSPTAVDVRSLSGPGGHDLLFVPIRERESELAHLPNASTIARLREATAAGPMVLGVRSPNGRASRSLVTRLPGLLLKAGHRTVCLFREGGHTINEDVLTTTLPEDGSEEEWIEFAGHLSLDAVGLEITLTSQSQWERALQLAPLTMVVLSGEGGDPPPGLNWLLWCNDDRHPRWNLEST